MKLIPIVLFALLCGACGHGLPKEYQNEKIQAVVKACYNGGGTTQTVYFPGSDVTTTCRWNLSPSK